MTNTYYTYKDGAKADKGCDCTSGGQCTCNCDCDKCNCC